MTVATVSERAYLRQHADAVRDCYARCQSVEQVAWEMAPPLSGRLRPYLVHEFLREDGVPLVGSATIRQSAQERRDVVIALHERGMRFSAIGRLLGISRDRARQMYNKAVPQ